MCCYRCGSELGTAVSNHLMQLEEMPILNLKCFVKIWRFKGHCSKCKKTRSEAIDFVCPESPHLTAEYGWWLGRLCEISAVTNAAGLCKQAAMNLWRHDFARMKRMLQFYKIPDLTRISVDEVYARKKKRGPEESRNDRFFTVVSDLKTHKVVFVSEGRSKEALDEFYTLLGPAKCAKIEVAAMDQFDGYKASTEEFCKNATVVWDKFHIMKNFEEAVNEVRKNLHSSFNRGTDIKQATAGKMRFIFLKRASKRTKSEQEHIDELMKINKPLFMLELIKEAMMGFFYEDSVEAAKNTFDTIGAWIARMGEHFRPLLNWHNNLEAQWETLIHYFKYRVTSALSEGINNVIKMLKRKAFGYRNMEYFRLKIMQKCGYLNSNHIPLDFGSSN